MPHTRSARKNLRKNEKRRRRNRAVTRDIKEHVKDFLTAVKSGAADQAKKELRIVSKKLDKAAARGVVHPNLAARKKSRLAKLLVKKPATAKAT
jgi:small subunit ribosomal protein S20